MQACEAHFTITHTQLVPNIAQKVLSEAHHHLSSVWNIITYLVHTQPPHYINHTTSQPLLPLHPLGIPPKWECGRRSDSPPKSTVTHQDKKYIRMLSCVIGSTTRNLHSPYCGKTSHLPRLCINILQKIKEHVHSSEESCGSMLGKTSRKGKNLNLTNRQIEIEKPTVNT